MIITILRKIIRKKLQIMDKILSYLRILKLKIIYPSLDINFGCYIPTGCQIICSDDSSIKLYNVTLSKNVVIRCDKGGKIKIDETFIGQGTFIAACNSIEIDPYCEIAEMVVIRDQNHVYGNGKLQNSGLIDGPIKIKTNVWIGSKASVFKGVEIGENSVVAGSGVVIRSIPPNEVWGGIPARKIKSIN
jgi:acetyltransferase-like isoleucine patch superfamily enzyme